jgi:RNA polymerase sigma-70 factor (ECF subfamily)
MTVALSARKAEIAPPVEARAFGAFVEARRERAVRMAFRLLGGDVAAAEDVAQNAFVRAYRGLGGFRGEASLDTWFFRILVREVQRHRRWQAVRRLFQGDPEAAPEPVDAQPAGDPALRRRIAAALERLTAAQREVFVLVHLEGFTLVEAAEVLGKAVGTLKSHLHRALASLRRELSDLRPRAAHDEEPTR